MGELIQFIASSIVEHPEEVRISKVAGETTVIYELSVATEDVGRVIGRRGRTANAMRTVLRAASGHRGLRVNLEIVS
ncbi:MAG: KH domain-containing protein [Anaerolineae bacterium]|nr:KH domain-containing protein [Anaerolineae bacterium]